MNAPCKVGDRIELIQMGPDPDPIPNGTCGLVIGVCPMGTTLKGESKFVIKVRWDIPRSLALAYPEDQLKVLEASDA